MNQIIKWFLSPFILFLPILPSTSIVRIGFCCVPLVHLDLFQYFIFSAVAWWHFSNIVAIAAAVLPLLLLRTVISKWLFRITLIIVISAVSLGESLCRLRQKGAQEPYSNGIEREQNEDFRMDQLLISRSSKIAKTKMETETETAHLFIYFRFAKSLLSNLMNES